ncbi:MAG: SGNH/GDSL hydrolase family protein, partial [Verrucomicrobiota bacterium]
ESSRFWRTKRRPATHRNKDMIYQALTGCLLAASTIMVYAQTNQNGSLTFGSSNLMCDAYVDFVEIKGLPRVLLVGDSISEGYTVPVRNNLRGRANVFRIPENGGPTTNGLAKLNKWINGEKWDVIYFNWGLHDLKIMKDGTREVSTNLYEANLRRLVRDLQTTGAKLVWATTTPVPAGDIKHGVKRNTADVPLYNAIARKVMNENNIAIDDLYEFAMPQLSEIQLPTNVHFKVEGYQALGKRVAASIETTLAKPAGPGAVYESKPRSEHAPMNP